MMDEQLARPHLRLDEVILLANQIQQAWQHSPMPPTIVSLLYAVDEANQLPLADFALAMYRLGIDHAAELYAEPA